MIAIFTLDEPSAPGLAATPPLLLPADVAERPLEPDRVHVPLAGHGGALFVRPHELRCRSRVSGVAVLRYGEPVEVWIVGEVLRRDGGRVAAQTGRRDAFGRRPRCAIAPRPSTSERPGPTARE